MEVTLFSRDVEISVAGGVAKTKDATYCDLLFFFFLISLIYCFYRGGNAHMC